MDKKSKIFFLVFFLLIAVVVVITYAKYFVAKDYYITAQADCDPETEACFIYVCDPEVDGECPEDEAEWTSYYKIVKKKANLIQLCDPNEEDCNALECLEGMDCEVTFCDEDSVAEGEECSDPETYLEENPPSDEEEEACDPDDEECLASEEEETCEPDDEECLASEEEAFETETADEEACSPDDE
ncbi:MAG: hypothetical protein EHM49_03865, partial [Deltaproteobacteria bacterium]